MGGKRTDRINSLLKEVISDVIHREVKNPHLPEFITITGVEVTRDLRQAKVFISVIGDAEVKKQALSVLQSAAGFIAIHSSKKVVMRYFPVLFFFLDDSVEKQIRMETLISDIKEERNKRESDSTESR